MSSTDAIGIAGLVAAILAIPAAYLFGRRARQVPDLRCAVDYSVLVDADKGLINQGLRLTFLEHPIGRVSRTTVAVWNQRGDTVLGSSVTAADPLRIQLGLGDIALQVQVLRQSRPQIKFLVGLSPTDSNSVEMGFDFLDPGDGAVIELLHQGGDAPEVMGTIRGARIKSITAALDADALRAVAATRARRFSVYVFKRVSRKRILAYLAAPVLLLTASVIRLVLQRPPILVNPGDYNLSTFQGQSAFAQRVISLGQGSSETRSVWLTLAGLAVAGLCYVAYALYFGSKAVIPASIVATEGKSSQLRAGALYSG